MKTLISVLFLVVSICVHHLTISQSLAASELKPVGEAFRVHGRLSIYNGTPSCRIWIIGDNRVLGIHEAEEECPIPDELSKILKENINDRAIYADFVVTPLSGYKTGVMQIVRFDSAENIIVTKRKGQFLRRVSGIIATDKLNEQKR